MANTAPKIAEAERLEAPDEVDRKAQTLVNEIKKSKHFIAFTGAGVSTSAGEPLHHWNMLVSSADCVQVFLTSVAQKAVRTFTLSNSWLC